MPHRLSIAAYVCKRLCLMPSREGTNQSLLECFPVTLRFTAVVWLGCFVTGCNSREAQVYGKVSIEGETLDTGTVRFEPTTGGAPAYSQIESGGSYELRTGRELGLAAGEYRATVVALVAPDPNWPGPGPPPPGKPITPLWYQDLESSGLQFNVEPGKNEIDIDLKKTPPPGWRGRQSQQRR